MHRCGCLRAYTGRVVSEPLTLSSFEAPVGARVPARSRPDAVRLARITSGKSNGTEYLVSPR